MTAAALPLDALRTGHGELATALVAGASAVVRLAAKNPLKLVVSRERGACARVHAATFGGGLLAGDAVRLDVEVGDRSQLSLGTSAPGKVYRSEGGRTSTQETAVRVGAGALCGLLPAPLTLFAGARYRQKMELDVNPTGTVLLCETLTSGRIARGERWSFDACETRLRLRIDGREVLHDALRLEPGAVPVAERMGAFEALSTIVLAGPRLAEAAEALHGALSRLPARRDEAVRVASSRWPWGLVVRAAGRAPEALAEAQREWLGPALALLAAGDDWHGPW